MTVVKSRIATVANATVTARLLSRTNWTTDHSEWVTHVTATTDNEGDWEMDLLPQSTFEDETSVWLIRHPYGQHLCVVPDAGPVWLDDIEITDRGEPTEETASLFVPKSQLGQPGGPATLGVDGKVPASQLPSGGGGSVPDATTLTKGILKLAGDLGGSADAPTVPGLLDKYELPGSGIPKTDLSAGVQASLNAADDSVTITELTDGLATKQPLGDYARKVRVAQRYISDQGRINFGNTSGSWVQVTELGVLHVDADPGDYIDTTLTALKSLPSTAVDLAVIVNDNIVRFLSSGTTTPAFDGDIGWEVAGGEGQYLGRPGGRGFTVQVGDLFGPGVDIAVVYKSDGSGSIDASTDYPLYWRVMNFGPTA